MSPGVYIAVFVVTFVAATVQGSTGFGQGLIAAPWFRLLEPDLLPGPIVMIGLLVALLVVARNTRLSDVRDVAPALGGRFVGIGVAIALLAVLSERGLSLAVGFIVLSFVILRLANLRLERTNPVLVGAGVASGIGGAIAALGGAPMALLYVQDAEARDFRGPLAAYTVIGSAVTVVALFISGEVDRNALVLLAQVLPAVALGMFASRWATPVIDRGYLRPLVLILSGCSSLVLIASELF